MTKISRFEQGDAKDVAIGCFLVPFDFDVAQSCYADVRTIIAHHDEAKKEAPLRVRALYDLRSGVIFRMIWIQCDIMRGYAASMDMSLDRYKPFALLQTALGGLDAETLSLRYLESAISQNPDLAEAHYHKAAILSALGQKAEAFDSYRMAIDLPPNLMLASQDFPVEARALHECGLLLKFFGRVDEAMPYFRRAVEISPDMINAQRELADGYRRLGRFEAAVYHLPFQRHYHQPLSTLPAFPKVYTRKLSAGERAIGPPVIRLPQSRSPVPNRIRVVSEDYKGFRVGQVYNRSYGILIEDGDFDYFRIKTNGYKLLIERSESSEVLEAIDEHWLREKYRKNTITAAVRLRIELYRRRSRILRFLNEQPVTNLLRLFRRLKSRNNPLKPKNPSGSTLIVEGFFGYNIVMYQYTYYAIRQGDGEFDINSFGDGAYKAAFKDGRIDQLKMQIERRAQRRSSTYGRLLARIGRRIRQYIVGFR